MTVHFGQIYIRPGITYPFSFHFQKWLSRSVSELIEPSPTFLKKYGADWNLIVRISAKADIESLEIRGPSRFPKDRDVEYSIFLQHPGSLVCTQADCLLPLRQLLDGVQHVLRSLEIDVTRLETSKPMLLQQFSADPTMVDEASDA